MQNRIELEDLIESYPSPATPEFQTLISAKKEFRELASKPGERLPPGRGKFFNHQKFTHRFLRAYDDLLITSDTGSGKSCEVIGFLEWTRRELALSRENPVFADEKMSHFKRVIILVAGANQKANFREQLICKCSDGHYETDNVVSAKNERSQKSAVSQEIKRAGYIVKTYTTFANMIASQYPDEKDNEKLMEDYSDSIIWLDEGHNITVDVDDGPNSKKDEREKKRTYNTLKRFFHTIRRSKRIISTATPMINFTKEVISLFNLILPPNGVLPLNYPYKTITQNDARVLFPDYPDKENIRNATPEELGPYFRGQIPGDMNMDTIDIDTLEPFIRGRVGFIKAPDTGAVSVEMGVDFNQEYDVDGVVYTSQLVLYTTLMSEHQSQAYMRARGGTTRDDLFGAERQAANFVFPDGHWGSGTSKKSELDTVMEDNTPSETSRGFDRYVQVKGDKYTATKELKESISTIDDISVLSSKYAAIIENIENRRGNAFVYGEFVKGSGNIVFALCLEAMGYVRYDETQSMFQGGSSDSSETRPICGSGVGPGRKRRIRSGIKPGVKRYVLLTRNTTDARMASMMEAMNSYENRHGDYIRIFISSRVGRDGININNVTQIYLVGPEWNQSAMHQAIFRSLRATSHEDLIREERDRLQAEGKDPRDAVVEVSIFKMAAVTEDGESTIDIQMYQVAESKDRKIKRFMRMLKQISVGCQVHSERNMAGKGIDGTSQCDFDTCKYICYDPKPDEVDYSTYDVVYADEEIDMLMDVMINKIYNQKNALSLDDLKIIIGGMGLIEDGRDKYIVLALTRLIKEKTPILDRFGHKCYMREDRGTFYLDNNYPIGQSSYDMSAYTNGVIAIINKSLDKILDEQSKLEGEAAVEELKTIDPTSDEFIEEFAAIPVVTKAELLEGALINAQLGVDTEYDRAVINNLSNLYFLVRNPVEEIRAAREKSAVVVNKRGRKKKEGGEVKIKRVNAAEVREIIKSNEGEPDTIVHTVYSQGESLTSYATSSNYNKAAGRIRKLDLTEEPLTWKDLATEEVEAYNKLIQAKIASKTIELSRKNPITGRIFTTDNKFKIVDKSTESENAKVDARKEMKGRVCDSLPNPALVRVLYSISPDILPEDLMRETGSYSRGEISAKEKIASSYNRRSAKDHIRSLLSDKVAMKDPGYQDLESWDYEKLKYHDIWLASLGQPLTRSKVCLYIRQRMEELGILMVI